MNIWIAARCVVNLSQHDFAFRIIRRTPPGKNQLQIRHDLYIGQWQALWTIFATVRQKLGTEGLVTHADIDSQLAGPLSANHKCPVDPAIVDEA
jgi:hypothetical protein